MSAEQQMSTPSDEPLSSDELQRTASIFHAIAAAIGEEGTPAENEMIAFEWPLADVLRLVPREYWVSDPLPPETAEKKTTVIIEALFDQLAEGRVTATVAQLLFGVSPAYVTAEAFNDQTTISLPLPMIVTALDPAVFRQRLATEERRYEVAGLPDLFCQPAPRPLVREPAPPRPAPARPPALPSEPSLPTASRLPGVRAFGAPPQAVISNLAAARAAAPRPPPVPSRAAALTLGAPAPSSAAPAAPTPPPPAVESVTLPLAAVLDLIPARHRVSGLLPAAERERQVSVPVANLLRQLAEGKVTVPVERLAEAVPPVFLQPSVLEDPTPVALPLPLVVAAVGLKEIARQIPAAERGISTDGLPDFFAAPPPTPPAAPPAVSAPAAPVAPEPLEPEEGMERLGGINLNTATVEQLVTLDKVSRTLAAAIVRYREEHGPFRDVFDLFAVPRIGRKTFRAITGMPYHPRRVHRRLKLAALLGLPPARLAHLPSAARALAEKPGFSGCVISDRDGLLLAQHGVDRLAETVSALVPRLIRELQSDLTHLDGPELEAVSLHMQGAMFTVAPAGDVYLTAFHRAARLTGAQFKLIRRVAAELRWLVSRRGYVPG